MNWMTSRTEGAKGSRRSRIAVALVGMAVLLAACGSTSTASSTPAAQKGTIKIEVQIDKPDLQITKPEMSVKVSFLDSQPAGGNEPLLIIPKDTVTADGGETYVWAVRGGLAWRVPIVRGRDVESGVEAKQGLQAGDILVLAPPANLSDGLKVFVTH